MDTPPATPVLTRVGPAPTGVGTVRTLGDRLDAVARTARSMLVARGVAWVLASGIGGALALAVIDLGLRLPGGARAGLLVAGLIALAALGRAIVGPAWRFRPSRSALALRIEALEPAHRGRIAPAVDLLGMVDQPGEAGAMARAGVERAGERLAAVNARTVLRWSGLRPALLTLGAGVAIVAGLAGVSPGMTRVGAARVLAPWTDARWPTRFGVEDLTGVRVHPMDEALPVRVGVGPGDPGSRVRVEWRVGDGETSRTPMAPQPARPGEPRAYERLVDPAGLVPEDRAESVLRYRVLTPDDRSDWVRVRLVRPPEVASAGASIEPPAHAAGAPGLGAFRTGERELTPGDATLGPILGGSSVALTWTFSKPVRPVEPETWSDTTLGVTQPDPASVRVTLEPGSPVRIAPVVADEHGLGVRTPVSAGLDVRSDAVPGVAIAEPGSDEIVTPDADLPVRAEAGDDVGLTALWLEATLERRPPDSPGAPPAAVGEPLRVADAPIAGVSAKAEIESALRPASLNAAPGDELVLAAVATDTRGETGRARSAPRRLRVVAPEELATRLRGELAPLARVLRRADEQQGGLIERARSGETGETLVREQAALGDSIDAAARSASALDQTRARNNLDDPALASLLRDLQRALGEGEDAARSAGRSLERDETEQALREQRRARDRIGEAMSMLDRGEDAFLARRGVARLREQLAQAREETAAVGQRTAGQAPESLSPEDRAELDRLAEQQRDLADKAREALEELTRRAESLDKDDPAQAEALRRAAEQGRAGAVASKIEQGGQQTGENQTGQAQQSQDEAIEQLDEMLEQIDAAAGLRDTALRRKLASLMESIKRLIETQATELEALARVRDGVPNPGLAGGMIALRENTLGVIEDASAALSELRLIAESLREAEGFQTDAARALRETPQALDRAEPAEVSSLGALERALAEAKKQDDQAKKREQDRKKAELLKAYRAALDEQSALRDASAPLLGRTLSRRERVESRRLADAQKTLGDSMRTLREKTSELSDAPVFSLAHDELERSMGSASAGLGEATPPAAVGLDQDQAVALLASLVSVLGDEDKGQDEDFQDGSGDNGDGQSGGEQNEPMIPPVAELRLLRDMQRAAMSLTRRLDETPALREDADRLARLGDLQRSLAERGVALIQKMNQRPTPGEQTPVEPDKVAPDREPSGDAPGSTDEEG